MMNKNLCLLIFLISLSSSCIGQNSNKKHVIYFQNKEVPKAEFESLDQKNFYTKRTENDTLIIEHIYLHKNLGKLDSVQYQQLTMFLTKIIGSDFTPGKKAMIHLYRKNGSNIYEDSNRKEYWRWIKRNSKEYQSFLIGTKDSQIATNKKDHIYSDQYDLLERLFFQNSDFPINHLFLKPNGEIYIYFGLDDILDVLDWSVD